MGWVGAPRPAAPSRPFFSLLSLSPLVPWASFAPSQPPKEAMARKGPSQAQPDCTKSRTIGQQLRVWERRFGDGRGEKGGVREREVGRQERGPRVRGAPPSPHRRSLFFLHTLDARIVPVKGGGPGAGPRPRLAEDGGDAGEGQNLAPPGRGGLAPARRVAASLRRAQSRDHVGPQGGPGGVRRGRGRGGRHFGGGRSKECGRSAFVLFCFVKRGRASVVFYLLSRSLSRGVCVGWGRHRGIP